MLIVMRVAIVGAGMGGLVLAQALNRAGDDVTVFERDAEVGATGGYRLHLNEAATGVIDRHLDPALVSAIWASSAAPDSFRQFAVTDHRLRVLALDDRDAGARLLIGRVPLRRLLCRGLGDRVHFGATVTAYAEDEAGVEVQLSDGSRAGYDLLVGADGVGSRVAEGLAGRPTAQRLGLGAIAGRTFLGGADDPTVPPLLRRGPALAVGPGGLGMFLTVHDVRASGAPSATSDPLSGAEPEPPALIWAVLGVDRHFPADVRHLPAAALPELAQRLIARWQPAVRHLVARAAPETAAYFSFSAADPAREMTPWTARRVTALGDAVHAMPPTGGQAAATAIRDAGRLADQLASVRAGDLTLPDALTGFQAEMVGYATPALAEALQPGRWIRAASGRFATMAAYAVLPAAAALSSVIRRATFGRPTVGTR